MVNGKRFHSLPIGSVFRFCLYDTEYRKVTHTLYCYHTDKKAVWKYWTPGHTKVMALI